MHAYPVAKYNHTLLCRGSILGNITRTWRSTSNVYREERMARLRNNNSYFKKRERFNTKPMMDSRI